MIKFYFCYNICYLMRNFELLLHKQVIIQMREAYPFGEGNFPDYYCMIRYKREFTQGQYDTMQKFVERTCNLKHQYLINTLKAFISRKKGSLQILYEYVDEGLIRNVKKLKKEQIKQIQRQLKQLSKFLIKHNMIPTIKIQNIGLERQKKNNKSEVKLKYFLTPQINLHSNTKKRQLMNAKQDQIKKLFLQILNQSNQQSYFKPNKIQENSEYNPYGYIYIKKNQEKSNFTKNSHSLNQFRDNSVSCASSSLHILQKIKKIDDKINGLLNNMKKPTVKLDQILSKSRQKKLTPKSNQHDHKYKEISQSSNKKSIKQISLKTKKIPTNINLKVKISQQQNQKRDKKITEFNIKPQKIQSKVLCQQNQMLRRSSQQSFQLKSHDNKNNQQKTKRQHQPEKCQQKLIELKKSSKNKLCEFQQDPKLRYQNIEKNHKNLIKKQIKYQRTKNLNQSSSFQINHQIENDILNTSHVDSSKSPYRSKAKISIDSSNGNHKTTSATKDDKIDKIKFQITGFEDILKNYDFQQEVTNDFNNMFQYQNTPTGTLRTKLSQPSRSLQIIRKSKRHHSTQSVRQSNTAKKKINERVKQALIKTQEALKYYKRHDSIKKSSNDSNQ